MTYFLMLLFVFLTLFALAVRWLGEGRASLDKRSDIILTVRLAFVWSLLGTFFFHNIW